MAILWLAILTLLLCQILSAFPSITERFYSQLIYSKLAFALSLFSGLFPFSLDDVFYTLLGATLFGFIVLISLKKLRIKESLILTANTMAACIVLFYWLWGFNYFREDFNTRLNIPERAANKTELLNVLQELVQETNTSYLSVDSIDKLIIDTAIETSYEHNSNKLKISYPSGTRRPKHISFSGFFAKAGISGYYGPFFNEVHINKHVLPVEYPMVLAHEKAHQFGITSEAEANFYAWLVCTKSDDQLARYSANLYILKFFIYEAASFEETKEIVKKLKEEVRLDYKKIRDHWMTLRNDKIDHVAGKMNDAYLKANKVEKGIEDYSGVVKFVMDYRGQQAYK